MMEERRKTGDEGRRTKVVHISLLVTRNLLWFIVATGIAVIVIQHIALLGLALAIFGGIVLGVCVTREVRA